MPSANQLSSGDDNPIKRVDEIVYGRVFSIFVDQFGQSGVAIEDGFDTERVVEDLRTVFDDVNEEMAEAVAKVGVEMSPEHFAQRFAVTGLIGVRDAFRSCVNLIDMKPEDFQDA